MSIDQRPLPETDFEVGEIVHWEQLPKGRSVLRTGTIVAVIPPEVKTADAVSQWRATSKVRSFQNNTKYRTSASRIEGEKGYLVMVVPRADRDLQQPYLYAPDQYRLTRKWIEK